MFAADLAIECLKMRPIDSAQMMHLHPRTPCGRTHSPSLSACLALYLAPSVLYGLFGFLREVVEQEMLKRI